MPWALIGDFNEIIRPSEQRGGDFLNARVDKFADMLDVCGMIDQNI